MNTRRLDLNLLVTLETLLAEQNVTRAAARLHLSQPAVSSQLNRLRKLFDDPLLIPAQRGMIPTAKALELLQPLRGALDQVRAVTGAHREFDPQRTALDLTIACTDYLQAALVAPLCIELAQRAPRMRVAVRHLDPVHLEQQMLRGDVDLALMTPQSAPPTLRTRHLFDEHYVLIARADHPRIKRRVTLQSFVEAGHVIVSLRGGDFSTQVDTTLARLGQRRRVAVSAASFLFVPDIVARSDFIALVPSRLVADRNQTLKVLEPPFAVEGFAVGMVWHERNHAHTAHRWVREALLDLTRKPSSRRLRP